MNPAAKGIATSEGQATSLVLLGAIVAALAPLDRLVQVVAIISAAVVVVAYIVARSRLKVAAVTTAPAERSSRAKAPG